MTTASRRVTMSPIRPLDASRDLLSVADLLEEAFQAELDASGQRAVREMRWMGRWGGFLAWLGNLFLPDASIGPGFVWLEAGQVIGTLSLRRATPYGTGWLIGNVAVKASYRSRGIARGLMGKAIEHIRQHGGNSIRLLVRTDNLPAMRLYIGLGFRQTGALAFWQHPAKPRRAPTPRLEPPDEIKLRRARPSDRRSLYDLASASQAADLAWAEPVRHADFDLGWDQKLDDWLNGRRRFGMVAESGQTIVGAAVASAPQPPDEGQLRVWTAPAYRGKLETMLVGTTLDGLVAPVAPLVCTFPAEHMPMYIALAQFGFIPLRILAHMRLDLRHAHTNGVVL